MDNKDKNTSSSKESTNQDASNVRTSNTELTEQESPTTDSPTQDRPNVASDNTATTSQNEHHKESTNQDASNVRASNTGLTEQESPTTDSPTQDGPNVASDNTATTSQNEPDRVVPNDETTSQNTSNQIPANSDSASQDPSNQFTRNIDLMNIADDDIPEPPELGASTHQPARKAARFDPTIADTSGVDKTAWRKAVSLRRLSDERELDADLFEAVLFHVGEFGRYQKMLLVAIIPFAVYFSWVYFTPMFLLLTPKPFWCKVPELSFLSKEARRDLSAPGAVSGHWDGCKVFKVDWDIVLKNFTPPPPGTPLVPCRNGWEHDYTEIPYPTVVSERGWVCGAAKYSMASQSAFFAGSLAGGLLFGWMADTYGRVPALIGVNGVGGVAGMVTIFTVGVWDFIICRFVYGMAFDNCFMIAYILVLEYVGPKHRTLVANLPLVIYDGTGAVALPWIAYTIANWRWFSFVTSLSLFVGCFAPWLLPESARWLISRGRVDEAVKVIKRFERINRTYIPQSVLNKFIATTIAADKKKKDSFMTMFRSKLLRQTVIFMAVAYCLLAVAYDALVRLSESFGFDFFITFTINAFVEIPSVIAVAILLDRLGRRNLTFGPTVLGAIFIIMAMFVPKGVTRVCFAVVARFLINLSYTVSMQWVAEILPTPFRATGSAAMHMCGFAISLMSPFIVYSQRYWSMLPLVILVVLSLAAAAFCLLVPETKGEEMPQTVADAENIIMENSLYAPWRGRGIKKALSSVRSSTFLEPIHRSPEGRVSLRLSRSRLIHN